MRIQSVNAVSKKRTDVLYAQLLEENDYTFGTRCSQAIQLRKSVLYRYDLKSHDIASRERTMQSLHLDLAKQERFCRAETRSRKTNSAGDIWPFRILIDLILWQVLVRSESSILHSLHRYTSFLIDFSVIFSISHRIGISYGLSTVKLHRYRVNDVARNIWEFWDSQWCYMMWFAFSFVIAELRHRVFAFWCIFYSILDINFRIDASSHEDSKHDRNFSDARSHVLQFDFTSYLEPTDSLNFDSFVSAIFASIHDSALKKFARKLQTIRRWESSRIRIAERVTSLRELRRWESLHENSKSDWAR